MGHSTQGVNMKYIIQAVVGETDQPDFQCDSVPLLPNVGERAMLITKDGAEEGIVKERAFRYQGDACFVMLICDHYPG
jgi:hypothetical protein